MKPFPVLYGVIMTFGAALALNALLLVYSWLPEYQFIRIITSSIVFIAMVAALILFFCTLKNRSLRAAKIGATVILSLLMVFSLGEMFTQFIYSQPFDPWVDLEFIPPLLDMMGVPIGMPAVFGALLLIAGLVWFPFYWLIKALHHGVKSAGWWAFIVLVPLLMGSILLGPDRSLAAMALQAITPAEPAIRKLDDVEPAAVVASRGNIPRYSFPLLEDRDVYLIIVESYGQTLFTRSSHFDLIRPYYREAELFLRRKGFTVYSSFLDSPTTGGRSWLADATLWTGIRIHSQKMYDDVQQSDVTSFMTYMKDAGYRRILTAPGTSYTSETWRSFFNFDVSYFRHDFGYRGPLFTLGAMPDQYLLKRTAEIVGEDKERYGQPVFVTTILVSSHVPFEHIPQYLEDWDSLKDGDVFNRIPMIEFDNNWLSGGEYPEGYTASIRYSLKSSFEYIDRFLPPDALIIIVGDHQPRLPVREREAGSSVPIHIISKKAELAKAFGAFGYTPGLIPKQEKPHAGMESFLETILAVIRGLASTPFTP